MHVETTVLGHVSQDVTVRDRKGEVVNLGYFVIAAFKIDRSQGPVLGSFGASAVARALASRQRPVQIVHVESNGTTHSQGVGVLDHIDFVHVARHDNGISCARFHISLYLIRTPNMDCLVFATSCQEMSLVITHGYSIHRVFMLI